MAPPKRKNFFLNSYEKEFSSIKRSKKGEDYAFCSVCDDDICLSATGKTAISKHQKTEKHKKAQKAANTSKGIQEFVPSVSAPKSIDFQVAACEGAWAYHIARHSQSFKSADCVSSDGFFKLMFCQIQLNVY